MNNNGSVIAGIVGGLIVYALFLGAIIYLSLRWSRRILERKAESLASGLVAAGARFIEHGESKGLYRGREAAYDLAGRRVYVNAYYVSRSWVRLNFRLDGGPFPWVTLVSEGAFQRLGKSLGISREVQLGDPSFDDSVYIDTTEKSDERVRDLLASDVVRAALKDLLGLGYRVQFSSRGVEAYRVEYAMTPVADVSSVRAIELVAQIVAEAPRFEAAALTAEPSQTNRLGIALVVGAVAFGAGIAGAAVGPGTACLDGGDVARAMLAGASLWVVFVVGLLVRVRGRSSAFSTLVAGSLAGFFFLPIAGGMLLLTLNQKLDDSPVNERVVTILRLHGKDHDLHVSSWRQGRTEERIYATSRLFHSLRAGDQVRVRAHAGRLGWPWVERVSERVGPAQTP